MNGGELKAPATFQTQVEDGFIKYVVEVLDSKQKFDAGLIIRKVRLTRRVYKKAQQLFNDTNSAPITQML